MIAADWLHYSLVLAVPGRHGTRVLAMWLLLVLVLQSSLNTADKPMPMPKPKPKPNS